MEITVRPFNIPGYNNSLVDKEGKTFAIGWVTETGRGKDYKPFKYDPLGNELWSRDYDGPVHGDDIATAEPSGMPRLATQRGSSRAALISYGPGLLTGYPA